MLHLSGSFHRFCEQNRKYNRIANILWYVNWKKEAYRIPRPCTNIIRTSEINYINIRKDGMISYLPEGKPHQTNEDGEWSLRGRQYGNPARVVRKLFTPQAIAKLKLTDAEFEAFANSYKAAVMTDHLTFMLRPAKDIPKVYHMSFPYGDGSLQNSCMRDAHKGFFDIYTHCPNLEILTLTGEWIDPETKLTHRDYIYGRCLVWSLKDGDKDIKLMDRCYVAADHIYDVFKDYARQNGFWRKQVLHNRSERRWFCLPDGSTEYRVFKVETPTEFEKYPYLDTFLLGDNGFLTNDEENAEKYRYQYSCTDGTRHTQVPQPRYSRSRDPYSRAYDGPAPQPSAPEGQVWLEYLNRFEDENLCTFVDSGTEAWRNRDYLDQDVAWIGTNTYYIGDPVITRTYLGEYALTENCVYGMVNGAYRIMDRTHPNTRHDTERGYYADSPASVEGSEAAPNAAPQEEVAAMARMLENELDNYTATYDPYIGGMAGQRPRRTRITRNLRADGVTEWVTEWAHNANIDAAAQVAAQAEAYRRMAERHMYYNPYSLGRVEVTDLDRRAPEPEPPVSAAPPPPDGAIPASATVRVNLSELWEQYRATGNLMPGETATPPSEPEPDTPPQDNAPGRTLTFYENWVRSLRTRP